MPEIGFVFRNADGMDFCGRLFPEESPGAEPGLPWSAAFEFCLPAAEVASVTGTYLQAVLVMLCGSCAVVQRERCS